MNEIRENDGLFEITTDVKREEGVVEFGLKSVFYNGIAPPDKEGKKIKAAGPWVKWLHEIYDKILMESAIRNCMR